MSGERIYGIFEEAIHIITDASVRSGGIVTPQDVANSMLFLRKAECDSHLVIHGQNGIGKSMAGFEIKACLDPKLDIRNTVVLPTHTYAYAIEKIGQCVDSNLMFDEMSVFLNYKQSMSTEQQQMFTMFEMARQNRNAFISCTRDIQRLNNNYRNGKAAICVYLVDRITTPGSLIKSYGAVLVANPIAEIADKFFLNSLWPTYDFREMCSQLERLPSFAGYIFFDDVYNYMSKAEMKEYRAFKDEGVYQGMVRALDKLKLKEAKEAKQKERMLAKSGAESKLAGSG